MRALLANVAMSLLCLCSVLAAQTASPPTAAEQALWEAAYLGNLAEVKRLVIAGAAVDAADAENRNSLMWTAFNGHTPVAGYLLEKGAAVDNKDASGRTALMYASSGPFVETVELLLEKGAEVNVQGTLEGFTALMTAAAEGQTEVVRVLLSHGADPALKDKDDDTARTFAQEKGHAEVIQLLDNPPTSSKIP